MVKMQMSGVTVVESSPLCSVRKARLLPKIVLLAMISSLVFPFGVNAADLNVGISSNEVYTVSGSEAYDSFAIGSDSGNQGTVYVGAGATLSGSAEAHVGVGGGQGSINVTSGGTLQTNRSWIASMNDTNPLTTTGTVVVKGTGSSWTDNSSILVGAYGTGTVTISDGATLNTYLLGIGKAPWAGGESGTGTVTVTGDGTRLSSSGGIDVGIDAASPGSLTINDGAAATIATSTGGLYMGGGGTLSVSGSDTSLKIYNTTYPDGRSWLSMGGGTATFEDGATVSSDGGYIGSGSSNIAQMTITGKDTSWTSKVRVYVGGSSGEIGDGIGYLTVSDGAVVSTATGGVGLDDSSQGTIVLTGKDTKFSAAADSQLEALGNFYLAYLGTGNVLVSDGALLNADNHISIATEDGSNGTLSIGAAAGDGAANAGTITTSSIDFGYGTGTIVFNHTDTDYMFAPDITGAGAVDLYSGSTTFTGDLSGYTGTMKVDGATLSVADGQTLSIGGDYQQTAAGNLSIGLSSDISFGKLAVAGTADFASDTGLFVDVSDLNTLTPGETISEIVSAGTLNASTFTLQDNSALLNFSALLSSTGISLVVERGVSIETSVSTAGRTAYLGLARTLDNLSDTSNPEIADFIGNLNIMPTNDKVASRISQAAPVSAVQAPTISIELANTMSSVVQARQQSVRGFNSGDPVFSDRTLWVKPYGSKIDQDDVDGVNGFDADVWGLGLGADGEYAPDNRLGLAFFYTRFNGDTNNIPQKSDMDIFNLLLYGSRPITDATTNFFYQIGGGFQSTDTRRSIQAIGKTAKADFTSKTIFAQTKATKTYELAPWLKFVPGTSLTYIYFYNPSYKEKGAGGMNLDVKSFDTNSLVAALEGDLSWSLSESFEIIASSSVGYDLFNEDTTVDSSFAGGGAVFRTPGLDNSRVVYGAGIGLAKKMTDLLSFDAKYDFHGRGSDYQSHLFSAKLNWKF
ncbi:autotransporter domain-containing protein [uncultured Desulfuromonas sp.]|uniref:autotransporter outer membrane beta-barrel domain-containing protein n=1 Tax=uncultured Desulfuromonas sp. TaxID=181013 RepID=UPI002AAC17E6|nr:autotransporter domain-containing protein [uncultured Desulfuromonas sp.]